MILKRDEGPMLTLGNIKIAIIGLGYVGLPLAVEFGKKNKVVGFDINQERIDELRSGTDSTLEVSDEVLQSVLKTEVNDANGLATDLTFFNDFGELYSSKLSNSLNSESNFSEYKNGFQCFPPKDKAVFIIII